MFGWLTALIGGGGATAAGTAAAGKAVAAGAGKAVAGTAGAASAPAAVSPVTGAATAPTSAATSGSELVGAKKKVAGEGGDEGGEEEEGKGEPIEWRTEGLPAPYSGRRDMTAMSEMIKRRKELMGR